MARLGAMVGLRLVQSTVATTTPSTPACPRRGFSTISTGVPGATISGDARSASIVSCIGSPAAVIIRTADATPPGKPVWNRVVVGDLRSPGGSPATGSLRRRFARG